MNKALTLYELNNLVRSVLQVGMTGEYWVEAELSEAREVRGHMYMELVQKDLFAATPVAKASAKCWKSRWQTLAPDFLSVTGQQLHAGMKVLLKVYADFHETYGFSWIVTDINPEYTMGDMARKRQEIISQLKSEGVFDLQRELSIPLFCQRVAVISSASAAGYGDFSNQLENNSYGLKFYSCLFPAVMQGDGVENSIISALNEIYARVHEFDVVVIIRGGGATSDMSGFDTLTLAENVANFPLPVITGIGHDRDECVLDMVSCVRVKTPTAAAAYLVESLSVVFEQVSGYEDEILSLVGHCLERERHRQELISGRIAVAVSQRMTGERHHIEILQQSIMPLVERCLMSARHSIEMMEQRCRSLDPQILLDRGYSITLKNGRIVKNVSALSKGDEIETRLADGTVISVVDNC
jgi:exodeoxyribonuclease VII large subunit